MDADFINDVALGFVLGLLLTGLILIYINYVYKK